MRVGGVGGAKKWTPISSGRQSTLKSQIYFSISWFSSFLFPYFFISLFDIWSKQYWYFPFWKRYQHPHWRMLIFVTFSLLRSSASSVASLNFRLGSFASLSFPINQIILLIGCYFLSISIFTNQSAFNLIIIIVQFYHI